MYGQSQAVSGTRTACLQAPRLTTRTQAVAHGALMGRAAGVRAAVFILLPSYKCRHSGRAGAHSAWLPWDEARCGVEGTDCCTDSKLWLWLWLWALPSRSGASHITGPPCTPSCPGVRHTLQAAGSCQPAAAECLQAAVTSQSARVSKQVARTAARKCHPASGRMHACCSCPGLPHSSQSWMLCGSNPTSPSHRLRHRLDQRLGCSACEPHHPYPQETLYNYNRVGRRAAKHAAEQSATQVGRQDSSQGGRHEHRHGHRREQRRRRQH